MSNETMVVMVGAGVVAVIAFLALAYNVVRGVHGSLTNARVGEVYNFEYEQPYHGEPERILARVIEPVYTMDDYQIKRLNARSNYRANDPNFKRTKHLVTCEMVDGSIRNFYAERTKNVRRCVFTNRLFRNAVAAML
jgi:hypothetical protein